MCVCARVCAVLGVWQEISPESKYVGVAFGSDHARAMLRAMNHIVTLLPGATFWVQGLCKQHASGLCIAPLVTWYDFLNQIFCTIKLLHVGSFYNTFVEGIYLTIRASVVRIAPGDGIQPLEEDAVRSRNILDLCFYGRDLHVLNTCLDERERHRLENGGKLDKGKKLLKCLQGDWRCNRIVHFSDGSCCQSEAEAAAEIFDCVMSVIGNAIPVPALNKWTQMFPATASVCLGFLLHGIFPRAVEYAHTLAVPENAEGAQGAEDDVEAEAEGQAIGLPHNERKAQAREKQARSKKSLSWVKGAGTVNALLLWLNISRHVMTMHYYLFRDASSMQFTAPEHDPSAQPPLFDFCKVNTSRASQVLGILTRMLIPDLDGHISGWQTVYDRYGPAWPDGVPDLARTGLLLVYANVWRRLCWFFQRPPWRWVKIFDSSVPMPEGMGGAGGPA